MTTCPGSSQVQTLAKQWFTCIIFPEDHHASLHSGPNRRAEDEQESILCTEGVKICSTLVCPHRKRLCVHEPVCEEQPEQREATTAVSRELLRQVRSELQGRPQDESQESVAASAHRWCVEPRSSPR